MLHYSRSRLAVPGELTCSGAHINFLSTRVKLTIFLDPASNQAASLNGLPGSYSLGMPRYLPTVASFVPNIPLGSPLKISIHSWEAPIASPDTVTLAQQPDWIWFEARVLLDGICVALVSRVVITWQSTTADKSQRSLI